MTASDARPEATDEEEAKRTHSVWTFKGKQVRWNDVKQDWEPVATDDTGDTMHRKFGLCATCGLDVARLEGRDKWWHLDKGIHHDHVAVAPVATDGYHFCEICKGLANHKTSRHPWPSRSEATDE